jgi:hypothetical protein
MKKTLADYLLLAEKEFKYRLKFATEMTELHLEKLERLLQKYDLIDVEKIYKTPIQKNPMDFPTLDIAEVYIIDIVTRLPVSTETLKEEIYRSLRIPTNFMYVRSETSPQEAYNEEIVKNRDTEYKVKLENDDPASDVKAEDLYGDAYNKQMVDTLMDKVGTELPKVKVDSIFKKAMDKTNTVSLFTKVG